MLQYIANTYINIKFILFKIRHHYDIVQSIHNVIINEKFCNYKAWCLDVNTISLLHNLISRLCVWKVIQYNLINKSSYNYFLYTNNMQGYWTFPLSNFKHIHTCVMCWELMFCQHGLCVCSCLHTSIENKTTYLFWSHSCVTLRYYRFHPQVHSLIEPLDVV